MNGDLLSLEALEWLGEQGYSKTDHKTRMELIREAHKKFPTDMVVGEEED